MDLIGRDKELVTVRQYLRDGKNLVVFGKDGNLKAVAVV